MGPGNEEIPPGEVNLDIRFANLPNIAGAGNLGRKNWADECASIIDTGFEVWGLRSFARF